MFMYYRNETTGCRIDEITFIVSTKYVHYSISLCGRHSNSVSEVRLFLNIKYRTFGNIDLSHLYVTVQLYSDLTILTLHATTYLTLTCAEGRFRPGLQNPQ